MKGVSVVLGMIMIVIVLVALIGMAYTFAVNLISPQQIKSLQQKIIESNNGTFVDYFCQQRQYGTITNNTTEIKHPLKIIEILYKGDRINFSISGSKSSIDVDRFECLKQINFNEYENICDVNVTITIIYGYTIEWITTQINVRNNYTAGRYFEEEVLDTDWLRASFRKINWGIECAGIPQPKCERKDCITVCEDIYACPFAKLQKFYWVGEEFVRGG